MVLNLTVSSLRLKMEQIKERRLNEFKVRARIAEWQTRTVVQFIAATTGKEGASLQREALKISLSLDGEADTEEYDDDGSPTGEIDYIEHGSPTALSRNRAGSAEALMGGFR